MLTVINVILLFMLNSKLLSWPTNLYMFGDDQVATCICTCGYIYIGLYHIRVFRIRYIMSYIFVSIPIKRLCTVCTYGSGYVTDLSHKNRLMQKHCLDHDVNGWNVLSGLRLEGVELFVRSKGAARRPKMSDFRHMYHIYNIYIYIYMYIYIPYIDVYRIVGIQ